MATSPAGASRARRTSRAADREHLLDAAELLFADRGYDGVPVRDITELAGTRLAEINDQFGGKQELFKEVVRRRAPAANAERLARLAALPTRGTMNVRLGALVDAFALPLLERSRESEGWRAYLRLVAALHASRSPVLLLIADQFLPVMQACCARLREIFPGIGERRLINGYGFLVATSMTLFADNQRLDFYSQGRERSADFEAGYADLRAFVVGGLAGLGRDAD